MWLPLLYSLYSRRRYCSLARTVLLESDCVFSRAQFGDQDCRPTGPHCPSGAYLVMARLVPVPHGTGWGSVGPLGLIADGVRASYIPLPTFPCRFFLVVARLKSSSRILLFTSIVPHSALPGIPTPRTCVGKQQLSRSLHRGRDLVAITDAPIAHGVV